MANGRASRNPDVSGVGSFAILAFQLLKVDQNHWIYLWPTPKVLVWHLALKKHVMIIMHVIDVSPGEVAHDSSDILSPRSEPVEAGVKGFSIHCANQMKQAWSPPWVPWCLDKTGALWPPQPIDMVSAFAWSKPCLQSSDESPGVRCVSERTGPSWATTKGPCQTRGALGGAQAEGEVAS